MKVSYWVSFGVIATLQMSGCSTSMRQINDIKEQQSCLEETYNNSGLIIGIEKISLKDNIDRYDMGYLSNSQRKMYSKGNALESQDKYIIFDVYIKNTTHKALAWARQKAPVFSLIDSNGVEYSPLGQANGNMDNITAKIILGQQSNINPNRVLKGSVIFDVPTSEQYSLVVSMGRYGGGWRVFAGGEIMRCLVPSE